jgi:hypothetical protein
MFEIILKNHGVQITRTFDNNTFKIVDPYVENGIAGKEIKIVYFKSIAELLIWLGY